MDGPRPPHMIRWMVVTAVVFLACVVAGFVLVLDENRAGDAFFFAGFVVLGLFHWWSRRASSAHRSAQRSRTVAEDEAPRGGKVSVGQYLAIVAISGLLLAPLLFIGPSVATAALYGLAAGLVLAVGVTVWLVRRR